MEKHNVADGYAATGNQAGHAGGGFQAESRRTDVVEN